jgi:hypothetical protein
MARLRCVLPLALAFLGCGGDNEHRDPPPASAGPVTSSSVDAAAPPPWVARSEAGHLEVPAGVTGPLSRARMFYSFRPAEVKPEDAPILVLFNGGPGWATTNTLLPYGTGPQTMVASPNADGTAHANPASWTRFANLLYLDERLAGFSYALDSAGCSANAQESDVYMADAGDFVHALLDFLDAHEALRDNPVVITGESYGGTRAVLMNYLIQHYSEPATKLDPMLPNTTTLLPWLHGRVQAHLDAAFPAEKGQALGADRIAAVQFGRQVALEGAFGGLLQRSIEETFEAKDPDLGPCFARSDCNRWDVRISLDDTARIDTHTAVAMRDPSMLEILLGVAPTAVGSLAASARAGAVRLFDPLNTGLSPDVAVKEASLRTLLGSLPPEDAYWLPFGCACGKYHGDIATLTATLEVMSRTATFLTRARYDSWVYGDAYPTVFANVPGTTATIHADQPSGAARPGVLEISNPKLSSPIMARIPKYQAGHSITLDSGAELGADIEDWLRSAGVIH